MADYDEDWDVPADGQPKAAHYRFDLDQALASVVRLRVFIEEHAFTAEVLGTERSGHGVLIDEDGLVLTVGYLILEAEEVWLETNDGRVVRAVVLGYDTETGFGLVKAQAPLGIPVMKIGVSRDAAVGGRVLIGGAGGRHRSLAAHVVAKREFAGYWEYVLEEAIFTAPAHPNWSGAPMIGVQGELIGIVSLQVPQQIHGAQVVPLNMVIPIDLLAPVRDRLLSGKQPGRSAARPWLGLFMAETQALVMIIGCTPSSPAQRAGLQEGDVVLEVAGEPVDTLAQFYRAVWALGPAGVDVPLTLDREGDIFKMIVTSADREKFLLPAATH